MYARVLRKAIEVPINVMHGVSADTSLWRSLGHCWISQISHEVLRAANVNGFELAGMFARR